MAKLIDLTGNRYGRILVVEKFEVNKNKKTTWKCICDCGKTKIIIGESLKSGRTVSCGCYNSENLTKRNTIHGESISKKITAEFRTWSQMIDRCTNENNRAFKHYGGRGIEVCDRWSSNFNLFLEDMGRKPSKEHTLDRIYVNGNYSPDNCRWATWYQQAQNRRMPVTNTSGYRGVYWNKLSKKWQVQITYKNIFKHIGYYDEIEKAIEARKNAELKYWGKSS